MSVVSKVHQANVVLMAFQVFQVNKVSLVKTV